MQRDDQTTPAAEQFATLPTPSPYDTGFPSSAASAASAAYDLNTLDIMKRTTSSQAYEGQGGLHQHGLSSGANIPESTTGKKTRFVSDSNIPSVIGMGFGAPQTAPAASQTFLGPQHQHSLSHQQHPQSQQQQQLQQPPQQSSLGGGLNIPSTGNNQGNRSFSGNLGGLQTSPFVANSNSYPAPLNTPNSAANFPSAPQSAAPFLLGASASPMFAGFSPNAFSPTASFVPGVGMLSPPAQSNQTGRTVYVGNLPADASVDELLNHVKFGPIENVRVLPERSCAFISFLDGTTAAAFHADASVKKLSLHGQELKIGWGKPSGCPPAVLMAVQQSQATRNVYVQLGQDDSTTEESLRDDLSRFGPIDQVKIVRDKNIGFIHFLSISTAMKVVSQLPHEPEWSGKRINYGKDRCAYVPKSQQQNQAHNNQAAAMGMAAAASLGYPTAFGFSGIPASAPAGQGGFGTAEERNQLSNANALQQLGNRTIYLGNIHPETSTEEICNHIRGGILQTIRHIPEKHIAFVTFVDANSALAFHHLASYSGVMIHNRRLKIGWGKHSGPPSPAIAMAVQAGCSRNVYIGNIEDPDVLTEEKLRKDFGEHGEVELVNSLREKNCAFVNFCNIQNAIKAIEAMKAHPDYQNVKISHGKDRCGRSMQLGTLNSGNSGGNRKPSGSVSPAAAPNGNAPAEDNAGSAPTKNGKLAVPSGGQDMPPIDSSTLPVGQDAQ